MLLNALTYNTTKIDHLGGIKYIIHFNIQLSKEGGIKTRRFLVKSSINLNIPCTHKGTIYSCRHALHKHQADSKQNQSKKPLHQEIHPAHNA